MVTNRLTAEQHGSYEAFRSHCLGLLELLPSEGISELFLHPAPATVGIEVRAWELRLLRDDDFQQAIDARFDRVERW